MPYTKFLEYSFKKIPTIVTVNTSESPTTFEDF